MWEKQEAACLPPPQAKRTRVGLVRAWREQAGEAEEGLDYSGAHRLY